MVRRMHLCPIGVATNPPFGHRLWASNAANDAAVIWRRRVINCMRWVHLYSSKNHPVAGRKFAWKTRRIKRYHSGGGGRGRWCIQRGVQRNQRMSTPAGDADLCAPKYWEIEF